MNPFKIGWVSAAPWLPTGYGQQTGMWCLYFLDQGYDVEIYATGGLQGGVMNWNGIPVFPVDDFFDIADLYTVRKCDLLITLRDVWTINPDILKEAKVKAAFWIPVDCDPLGFNDLVMLKRAKATPIAMSRFGRKMLADAGMDALYVPHGIDTEYFTPGDAREAAGIEDPLTFVIGINATNRDERRKAFEPQLRGFKMFHDKHPNSVMLLHTLLQDEGLNLELLINQLDLEECIGSSDQHMMRTGQIGPAIVREWYRALSLYSGVSAAEGFGIPLIEAQSCGVPVAANNWASMPELVADGWLAEGCIDYNATHAGYWKKPHADDIANIYEKAYNEWIHPTTWAIRQETARKFAQRYDVHRVWEKFWKPALARLEKS